jgi:hypothetical protein
MFLTTQLMADLQRAGQFMLRHDGVSIGFADGRGSLGLYEAHRDGRLIGAGVTLGLLMDLLERAERL